MNKLVGVRWGALKEETKEFLLENAYICDDVREGDCIVDLTNTLSVAGKVVENEIVIDDEAIIYNPSEGVILEPKEIKFALDEVRTMNEAAEMWGISEGTIRSAIKSKKFIPGVDYRKAGRITLITIEAMERVYGEEKCREE